MFEVLKQTVHLFLNQPPLRNSDGILVDDEMVLTSSITSRLKHSGLKPRENDSIAEKSFVTNYAVTVCIPSHKVDKPNKGERNLNFMKKGRYNIVSSSPQTMDTVSQMHVASEICT